MAQSDDELFGAEHVRKKTDRQIPVVVLTRRDA
jgi:hypothetical protein